MWFIGWSSCIFGVWNDYGSGVINEDSCGVCVKEGEWSIRCEWEGNGCIDVGFVCVKRICCEIWRGVFGV